METKNNTIELAIKLTAVVILVGLTVIGYFLKPELYTTIWQLITSGDMDGTIELLRSFGVWAIVVSLIADILINMVGFLPSIFISTANGIVFGIGPGILISWFAETIGVILSFILMRTVLRKSTEELIQKSNMLKKIDEFSGVNGFKMMLFARTLPYFPSGLITAIGAISRISFKDYVLANFIGKLPSTALEVMIGYDVVNYKQNLERLTLVVVSMAVFYGFLWWYNKRKLANGET
jgi:uncharacterized membrane protein YdjX (TVP38/TMEM64 family)